MSDDADRPAQSDSPDEKIIKEAKRRFKRCQDWESVARKRYVEDVRFANGDSDNLWQWDGAIRTAREGNDEPCLTINKIRQHNLNILNDARENRPEVKVKAIGGSASYEAAQVYDGIVRRIEYISNADTAYDTAMKFQVEGGIGYIRLATDFAHDDTFDQDIYIRRIADPLTVYLDPDAKEADKSDAKYGFVFDDMAREAFDAKYPDYKDMADASPLGDETDIDWLSDKKARVCEYFRCVEDKDQLIAMTDPQTGQKSMVRKSRVPKDILDLVIDDPQSKTRDIVGVKVERYLIVGEKIAEKSDWLGRYIPIIPVIGEEIVIKGQYDRWGHTRAAKDPQRIYNYWSSSAVQQVALQTKTPYIGAMEAFEGLETYWEAANRQSTAWLPYNGLDDKGQPIPRPERAEAPSMAQGYIQGMQIASQELQAVSGQFNADMGMEGNERTGIAIRNRQRVGDISTSHYLDNLRVSIRNLGKQLVDLIPKIYDTERIIKIMAEDGTEKEVTVDPQATQAYFEQKKAQGDAVKSIFNPNVGQYDVEASSGPGYATRRQEAFEAFSQIATQNQELMTVIGDLMFRFADFPGADEIAERLKRMVPPQALGEAPPPAVQQAIQQAQMQTQRLTQLLAKELEENASLKLKLRGKDELRDVEVYRAETDRIKVLKPDLPMDAQGLAQMVHQLVQQSLQVSLGPVISANAPTLEASAEGNPLTPPMPPMMQQQQPQQSGMAGQQ